MARHLPKFIQIGLSLVGTNWRRKGAVRTADLALKARMTGSVFITYGAEAATTFSLPADAPLGTHFTFIVGAAQELRIDPAAGEQIAYDIGGTYAAQTAAKYATANALGERMTVVSDGAGVWWAIDQAGTWTEET